MFVQLFELIKLNIVHLAGILIYCLEGLVLAAVGYKLFQFIIPLKPYDRMGDREKVGVAIMVAGLVVGMSIIVAQTSLKKPPILVNIPVFAADYYRSIYSQDKDQSVQPIPKTGAKQNQSGCGSGCGGSSLPINKPRKAPPVTKPLPAEKNLSSAPSLNRPVDENIWLNANSFDD